MKVKQLEALQKQHGTNLKRKLPPEPSLGKAISLAIISGQEIKLKPTAEILKSARANIAECSCSYGERTLKFSDIFAFKSGELNEYTAAKKRRDGMIETYLKGAGKILRRAEMDDAYDAQEASEALAQVAHDAGLMD